MLVWFVPFGAPSNMLFIKFFPLNTYIGGKETPLALQMCKMDMCDVSLEARRGTRPSPTVQIIKIQHVDTDTNTTV